MTPTTETTVVHHFRRGDLAVTRPYGDESPSEIVEILGGRNITVGIGETERTERWLRVRFPDGGVLLCHPSNLLPIAEGHRFTDPTADTAEICACGAAFVDGFHLEAVKIAHLIAVTA